MDAAATRIKSIGDAAEAKVIAALAKLPLPWQAFNTVEWRKIGHYGEEVGEADVVVFHPAHGLVVFEIKAGEVSVMNGQWLYASGRPMKQSPFAQARRNRFALMEKLERRLGKSVLDTLTITHAVWFPDVRTQGRLQIAEAPSPAFVFDYDSLNQPEARLLKLFAEANPAPQAWNKVQQHALKELLAPDCHLLTPLSFKLDNTLDALHRATDQQIAALRVLRTQKRLLVEGGAGSGKTLLAVTLAREHAIQGRKVLFTCFNKALAQQLAAQLADYPAIRVLHFHELVRQTALEAGLPYDVPSGKEAQTRFFHEDCAELLMTAAEQGGAAYDSLIVDEAADFTPTWWVALEALGAPGFSWYCFFDRHQSIYQAWTPPFAAEPMPLDINLRNTRPVGTLAARLGHCPVPAEFRVAHGQQPDIQVCRDFREMAVALRQRLQMLMVREGVAPERIVVLAPYRHTNAQSGWAAGLDGVRLNTDVSHPVAGQVRVGTVQGFKGLEADVVILTGLNAQTLTHPELLYVGASRAKAALYILTLAALDLEASS